MNRGGRAAPRRSPTTPTSPMVGGAYNQQEGHSAPQASSASTEQREKPLYLCSPFVEAKLVKGNFKTIVQQPKYVDLTEWVGVNIFDFYQNVNLFYGVVAEFCTVHSCPTMSAGQNLDYTWIDASRRQVKLPAPTYIDYVMTWVQNLLDDENTFPTKANGQFPQNFAQTVRHVYRQLLRVLAHIYHAHYQQILHLRSEPHFNSLFAHYLAFGAQYELFDIKDLTGGPGAPVGVGELWEKWKEMGILEA
ncbi:Mob1/phocein [Auriculariales sp. MPI-PUGE-AT-0066]|nr:Mob1/phocein [Auriculariales sp. MPI-PUGE-AT-0066]